MNATNFSLQAKLQLSRESRFVIKNGHLHGNQTDENFGVEFLVKYRIDLLLSLSEVPEAIIPHILMLV